jgi:MFS family permease
MQTQKWRTIFLSAAAILLAMGLWFSASVVVPTLSDLWNLDDAGRAGLTISVQIGFVVGSVISALFNLADRIRSRYLITTSVFLAALSTALIAAFVNSLIPTLILRFLTGIFMVGVYPVLMKIIATWTKADRGLGIGLLTGAIAVGSASPNLLITFGGIDNWRLILFLAAVFASLGGIIVYLFVQEGPYGNLTTAFDWKYAAQIFRIKELRLANLGYLGHMWELFAMWAWVGLFLSASFEISGLEPFWSSLITFFVIAAGGLGSILAGIIADRFGRTMITMMSLLFSGTCAILVGFLFGAPPALLTTICLIWGFTVVADSAQFSAAIS